VRKDINGDYVLTNIHHVASVGNAYTNGEGGGNQGDYSNSFTCIPAKTPFRAPQTTPKPMVQGPQTAVVVGKSGEEIWTDKYGRVKVQFHWDRYGKRNEESSCWVRVSQNWAGKNWGAMFIPRMGQEVIVEFLEGDPDQPIITGRVYNAEQTVPYELPANQTMSAIKSYSSKGGEGFNEFRFEDKKGEEQIFLHAQKNMDIRVLNDRFETIGKDGKGNRHLLVEKNKVEHIKNERHETVDADHVEKIGKDRHVKVVGKEAIEIGGSHSFTVKGDVIEVFKANHSEQTTDDYYVKATNVVIEATSNITLKVGGSSIAIEASGITIQTPATMEVKGTQVTVKADAQLGLEGAMTELKGSGMTTIKGGVIMIN
jgi:type VI secretion system secreted protein VgrG